MVSFAVAGMISFLTSRTTHYMSTIKNPADVSARLTALINSFGDTFLLATGLAVLGWLIAWTLKRPKIHKHNNGDEPNTAMMSGH